MQFYVRKLKEWTLFHISLETFTNVLSTHTENSILMKTVTFQVTGHNNIDPLNCKPHLSLLRSLISSQWELVAWVAGHIMWVRGMGCWAYNVCIELIRGMGCWAYNVCIVQILENSETCHYKISRTYWISKRIKIGHGFMCTTNYSSWYVMYD